MPAELLNVGTAGDASLTTAALAAAGLAARLHAAEQHNATLSRDAELQRAQYERCLDDVANQVVRALLSQKVTTRISKAISHLGKFTNTLNWLVT